MRAKTRMRFGSLTLMQEQRANNRVRRLCVFSGSSLGARPAYREAAAALGAVMAREGVALVYGGASVGLMGTIADAVLAGGGEAIGVIPRGLFEREIAHTGLTELRVVGSMHERKAMMSELSDGFVALPGGIGTFEEIFEIWTWGQLGSHQKPCAFYNIAGFYDHLLKFLDFVVDEAFLKPVHRGMVLVESQPVALLAALRQYRSVVVPKWIEREER
jgi:uncharacterized protein (TIGR00730 family)